MTPKGVPWTDEQKQRQSQRMKQAIQRSPADRRMSALKGHATRRRLKDLKDATTKRQATP
jgi:hypothetical protein